MAIHFTNHSIVFCYLLFYTVGLQWFRKQEFIIEAMQKIENMKPLASSKGWNITELAVKFILSQKQISVILPTMISIEEIELFASLSDGKYLNSAEFARMEEMYEKNFYVEPVVK